MQCFLTACPQALKSPLIGNRWLILGSVVSERALIHPILLQKGRCKRYPYCPSFSLHTATSSFRSLCMMKTKKSMQKHRCNDKKLPFTAYTPPSLHLHSTDQPRYLSLPHTALSSTIVSDSASATRIPYSHIPIFPSSHLPIFPYSHIPIFPYSHIPIFPYSHIPIFLYMFLYIHIMYPNIFTPNE